MDPSLLRYNMECQIRELKDSLKVVFSSFDRVCKQQDDIEEFINELKSKWVYAGPSSAYECGEYDAIDCILREFKRITNE